MDSCYVCGRNSQTTAILRVVSAEFVEVWAARFGRTSRRPYPWVWAACTSGSTNAWPVGRINKITTVGIYPAAPRNDAPANHGSNLQSDLAVISHRQRQGEVIGQQPGIQSAASDSAMHQQPGPTFTLFFCHWIVAGGSTNWPLQPPHPGLFCCLSEMTDDRSWVRRFRWVRWMKDTIQPM